ncbi:MAG: hypothetical protein QXD43_00700 [Candidatus Aenigmatarchaeota archaeon]
MILEIPNDRKKIRNDDTTQNYGSNIVLINKLNLLKDDEICVLGYDNENIYVYDEEQFFKALKENLKMKPYKGNSNERIFYDKGHLIIFKLHNPVFSSLIKNGEIETSAYVSTISRNVLIKNEKVEENLDVFPLIDYYTNSLGYYDLLDRVEKILQEEWDKIHKDKKPNYIA